MEDYKHLKEYIMGCLYYCRDQLIGGRPLLTSRIIVDRIDRDEHGPYVFFSLYTQPHSYCDVWEYRGSTRRCGLGVLYLTEKPVLSIEDIIERRWLVNNMELKARGYNDFLQWKGYEPETIEPKGLIQIPPDFMLEVS